MEADLHAIVSNATPFVSRLIAYAPIRFVQDNLSRTLTSSRSYTRRSAA